MNQLDRKCQRLNDRLKNNMDKANCNELGNSVADCMQKINELDDLEAEDDDTLKEVKELHEILD